MKTWQKAEWNKLYGENVWWNSMNATEFQCLCKHKVHSATHFICCLCMSTLSNISSTFEQYWLPDHFGHYDMKFSYHFIFSLKINDNIEVMCLWCSSFIACVFIFSLENVWLKTLNFVGHRSYNIFCSNPKANRKILLGFCWKNQNDANWCVGLQKRHHCG